MSHPQTSTSTLEPQSPSQSPHTGENQDHMEGAEQSYEAGEDNLPNTAPAESSPSNQEEPTAEEIPINDEARITQRIAQAQQAIVESATTRAAAEEAALEEFRNRKEECVICTDELSIGLVEQLPCGKHFVCRECLPSYFANAIEFQSSYPPRCCSKIISLEYFQHLLSDDLIARYLAKTAEYHTDPRLRRYCAEDKTFLHPNTYEDVGENKEVTMAQCTTCSKYTCIVCIKLVKKDQPEHSCILKPVTEINTEYSRNTRFKACPFCGRLSMLDDGCNHVTCLPPYGCGQDWCFICLEPWRSEIDHSNCQPYNDPVYDAHGYDERGFHRDSGFDREGYTRAGYNIRGLNRDGERMAGFAARESRDQRLAQRNQTAMVLGNLGAQERDEARLLDLIMRSQNGEFQQGDIVEDILDREDWGNDGEEGELGHDPGHHQEDDVGDESDEGDTDGEGDEHNTDDEGEAQRDDHFEGTDGAAEDEEPEVEAELDAPSPQGEIEDDEDTRVDVSETDGNAFAVPSPEQLACQHVWDFVFGNGHCGVCHLDNSEWHYSCPMCQIRTCSECMQDFTGNMQLNYPDGFDGAAERPEQEDDITEGAHGFDRRDRRGSYPW